MCNAFIMQMVLRNVFFVDRRLVTLKISNFLMVLGHFMLRVDQILCAFGVNFMSFNALWPF